MYVPQLAHIDMNTAFFNCIFKLYNIVKLNFGDECVIKLQFIAKTQNENDYPYTRPINMILCEYSLR